MIPNKFRYKEKIACSICGNLAYQQSSIKIHLSDANHNYKGSNRGWIDHYSMKLCKKHYNQFTKGLEKAIKDLK